jgi:hypothetical protein
MTISELETALQEARERLVDRTSEAWGSEEAWDAVFQAERALAAAKGEQYAVLIDFPVRWDTGAPCPHLLQADNRTFLVFFLLDVDPTWDGTWVRVRHPDSPEAQKLAVVEFEGYICTKMGLPREDAFDVHPLYGKGFVPYRAMSVENSAWVKELETIMAVDHAFKAECWRELKHYIFPFHDSTFECIALGFTVETFHMGFPRLLSELCQRLVAE